MAQYYASDTLGIGGNIYQPGDRIRDEDVGELTSNPDKMRNVVRDESDKQQS